ncbi:sugar phosphate isomerase/epimerase family protein [Methanotorris igneus]|uniref:Xylose isomerase domain-containing protein TIM barrel n=1 Tax=Methanotorris igneus (strain DSM 5666 / JCM 11834 / Kol 5) TaxID=880724 RepID=F6BDK3_METIK|nr:sugar phosphate isomerase/epimerase family protein [Methanotorris igneus]AEF96564.1 Xylose isomerase domain-containing protein TIM barrel [Methanotorris igneus Kol 5]
MRVGINSQAVKEFNKNGMVWAKDVELIELSLAEVDFINDGNHVIKLAEELSEEYNIRYTIHAPYQDSPLKSTRIKFTEINNKNIKIMERVLELSYKLGAECVVIHGGDVLGKNSIKNVIKNLKEVCNTSKNYGITLALENVFTNEKGIKRAGETPEELLYIVENVGKDTLGINIDIGHAYISSQMHNINIEDYFETLNGHVIHIHAHNNVGLCGEVWDKHLPIFNGKIDYTKLQKMLKTKNIILEVKSGSREEVLDSLKFLSGKKCKKT